MSIKLDLEALKKEIQTKQQAKQPPAKARALREIQDVCEPSMTLQQLVGYLTVMSEKSWIASSLDSIEVQEVFSLAKASVGRRKASRSRKKSDATQTAMEALTAFLGGQKDKLSKNEILAGVQKANPELKSAVLNTAWLSLRNQVKDEGVGPSKRYWLPKS